MLGAWGCREKKEWSGRQRRLEKLRVWLIRLGNMISDVYVREQNFLLRESLVPLRT